MPYAIVMKPLKVGDETAEPGSIVDISGWHATEAYTNTNTIMLLPENPEALEALADMARDAAEKMKKEQASNERKRRKADKQAERKAKKEADALQKEADDAAAARQAEFEAEQAEADDDDATDEAADGTAGDSGDEAGSDPAPSTPDPAEDGDDAPTPEEQAAQLVKDNKKDELVALANDYDIDTEGKNKDDLAAEIVVAMNTE